MWTAELIKCEKRKTKLKAQSKENGGGGEESEKAEESCTGIYDPKQWREGVEVKI